MAKYPPGQIWRGQARLAMDNLDLTRTEGLCFWRLLAAGRGDRSSPKGQPLPNLGRSALFAVWGEESALDGFLRESPVAGRWGKHTREMRHVKLQPIGTEGNWGGINPAANLVSEGGSAGGPIATLTVNHVRMRSLLSFWTILPAVNARTAGRPGFIAGLGLTEFAPPLVRNVNFSLWRSLDDVLDFGYREALQTKARSRSDEGRWFSEFLFIRFRPYASEGTWDGIDPLAASHPLSRRDGLARSAE